MRRPGREGSRNPSSGQKTITRRRIPTQKKEDKLCVARGSRRYLESAGGGRPSDYSLRGAPHPRAAERIFPWGGVSESGGASLPLSSWDSVLPRTRDPRKPPSPFPRGPISPRLPTRELPTEAPGCPQRTSPRSRSRGTAEPG